MFFQRDRPYDFQLFLSERFDIVIPAFYHYSAILVGDRVQHSDQTPRRILNNRRTSRMRILQRGLNSKLNIEHSLQAQRDQWSVLVVEASELPDRRVSGQPLLVARNELGEVEATNLFLTLDHPFEIAGNGSGHLQECANRH